MDILYDVQCSGNNTQLLLIVNIQLTGVERLWLFSKNIKAIENTKPFILINPSFNEILELSF